MLETDIYKILFFTNRERLLKYFVDQMHLGLDLVISVHPLLNHIPHEILTEIDGGVRKVPFATVVTDLGSAHLSWFDPRINSLYVPSDALYQLATQHHCRHEQIYQFGLPIREGFWLPDKFSKDE